MSQDIIDRATNLINQFDARVQAVSADGWSAAAPCDGWTARDVVVHVSDNLSSIGNGLLGAESHAVATDEDIVAAWATAKQTFFDAMSSSDLSQTMPGPMGPMPAADIIGRMICTDVLVHTWDLARASGGDEQLDAVAVTQAYSGMKPMDQMIRRPGVFGPKIDVAEDADEQTQFLSFLGRQV